MCDIFTFKSAETIVSNFCRWVGACNTYYKVWVEYAIIYLSLFAERISHEQQSTINQVFVLRITILYM